MNSNKLKLQVAQNLLRDPKTEIKTYFLECYYHEVPVTLAFSDKNWLLTIKSFLPKSWQRSVPKNSMRIRFITPESIDPSYQNIWEQEADHEFHVSSQESNEIAFQRDFLGIYFRNQSDVLCICKAGLTDGYFNSMRWILPRFMLAKNLLLMHSSCVIDSKHDRAHLFLGPSNAGKSTIASLAGSRLVLGDDMNVLGFNDKGVYLEAGGFGQNPKFQGPLAQPYQLAGLYWLTQSRQNQLRKISKSDSIVKLLTCAMSYSESIPSTNGHDHLLELVEWISSYKQLMELKFIATNEFWSLIEDPNQQYLLAPQLP